ncbi:hypothetical protein [Sphingomonas humi]|uniref:hypothetical protein n=1 Tax=Sphingomonas humi TaxID=335630 RepID=UPI0031D6D6AD
MFIIVAAARYLPFAFINGATSSPVHLYIRLAAPIFAVSSELLWAAPMKRSGEYL